jgi:hypothetical protein
VSTVGRGVHRQLDREFASAVDRDDRRDDGGQDDIARPRRWQGEPKPKVLLLTLSERTSGRGTRYMRGWLGRAAVVAFEGKPDEAGHATWDVYVSTPEPRQGDKRQTSTS